MPPHPGPSTTSAYLRPVAQKERGTALAIIVYTLLRVALFVAVWVLFEFLTPIHGLWAAASAILISGAISIVVLDRQRGRVGVAAGRFFGRINARIEESARAEDEDEPSADGGAVPDESQPPAASGEGQDQSEHEAVDKQ